MLEVYVKNDVFTQKTPAGRDPTGFSEGEMLFTDRDA